MRTGLYKIDIKKKIKHVFQTYKKGRYLGKEICSGIITLKHKFEEQIEKDEIDKSYESINPIHDWQKGLPTSFSSANSTNRGIKPQNFLTFSFNPFTTLVYNCKLIPTASPKLLNLNQDHPSKKVGFLVKSL